VSIVSEFPLTRRNRKTAKRQDHYLVETRVVACLDKGSGFLMPKKRGIVARKNNNNDEYQGQWIVWGDTPNNQQDELQIVKQELAGLREQLHTYRQEIARLMNELKEDVSTRLMNFAAYGEFVMWQEELNKRFDRLEGKNDNGKLQ